MTSSARALALLICLTGSTAAAAPPSLRLAARTVPVDTSCSLPEAGSVYVLTDRGVGRDVIAALSERGLRYLGVAGPHAYAFAVEGANEATRSYLLKAGHVVGTALVQPQDRLRRDVLDYLAAAGPEAQLPFPLAVTLWPGTPAEAARRVLPEAQEDLRWSRQGEVKIGLESAAYLPKSASTVARLDKLMGSPFVAAIGFDAPRVGFNEQSRSQSNSNQIFDAPYALDGAGVVVGHWDGGSVDDGHPDLAGRVENLDGSGVSSHATHTAGTILGSGFGDPDARGHAPGSTMVARDYNGNTPRERRATKHSHYHQHDNHSWGQDPDSVSNYGTYNQVGYEFDVDARDLFLLAVKAAGNEGRESEVIIDNVGFDSLSPDSTGKNALVVGATNDRGRLAVFSSRGPTEDGRLKPDLCAVGVNVRSTTPGGGYGQSNGTSMSTPGVSGMLALVSQLYTREQGVRWAPDVSRGLMIHTARDVWNRGPDYRYGWGLADAQAAADLVLADVAAERRQIVRGAVREDESKSWTFEVPPTRESLKVTLSWIDAFANAPAEQLLLHDLDLVLTAPDGTVHFPWRLDPNNPLLEATQDARNPADNVEQVFVDNPSPGTWTAEVRATSITDPNLPVQGFVLIGDLPFEHHTFRYPATFDANLPASIPDADEAGRAVAFDVPDVGEVTAVRVRAEINHDVRGHLRILLEGPDGTRATLETEDGSERRDIYAIYPDTRSYDDDVLELLGKPSFGRWTVYVIDLQAGGTGEILELALELDTDGQINQPPTAVARADSPVRGGETARLLGAASRDPEGRPMTYAWTQLSGPDVELGGAQTATATFVAPDLDAEASVTFELVVDDGRGATDSATVAVMILPPNQPPVADAGEDVVVQGGRAFALDATASSDPDGDPLTYQWRQISGPELALPDPTLAEPPFVAPLTPPDAPIEFELTVDDGAATHTDTVLVTVTLEPPGNLEADEGCGCTSAETTQDNLPWLSVLAVLGLVMIRRRR